MKTKSMRIAEKPAKWDEDLKINCTTFGIREGFRSVYHNDLPSFADAYVHSANKNEDVRAFILGKVKKVYAENTEKDINRALQDVNRIMILVNKADDRDLQLVQVAARVAQKLAKEK